MKTLILLLAFSAFLIPTPSTRALACKGCTAGASMIPFGCAAGNTPTFDVDLSAATSGHCAADCSVIYNCSGSVTVTMAAAAGTWLDGGGLNCDAFAWYAEVIDTCGKLTLYEIDVHTGNPCTIGNQHCTVNVAIGCASC